MLGGGGDLGGEGAVADVDAEGVVGGDVTDAGDGRAGVLALDEGVAPVEDAVGVQSVEAGGDGAQPLAVEGRRWRSVAG